MKGRNARYAVEVLRDLRGKAGGLEDTVQPRRVKSQYQDPQGKTARNYKSDSPEDLVTGDRLDLGDTVRVTEDDAALARRAETLANRGGRCACSLTFFRRSLGLFPQALCDRSIVRSRPI